MIVERHLDLAQRMAARVDAAPDLERLAGVPLNIVCFRYRPEGVSEDRLDDLNRRLGAAVIEDGRVAFGTTTYGGPVGLRPAFTNWRIREQDVDLAVDVTRELGARLVRAEVTFLARRCAGSRSVERCPGMARRCERRGAGPSPNPRSPTTWGASIG